MLLEDGWTRSDFSGETRCPGTFRYLQQSSGNRECRWCPISASSKHQLCLERKNTSPPHRIDGAEEGLPAARALQEFHILWTWGDQKAEVGIAAAVWNWGSHWLQGPGAHWKWKGRKLEPFGRGKREQIKFGEYRLFLGLGKHSILLKIVFSFKVFWVAFIFFWQTTFNVFIPKSWTCNGKWKVQKCERKF